MGRLRRFLFLSPVALCFYGSIAIFAPNNTNTIDENAHHGIPSGNGNTIVATPHPTPLPNKFVELPKRWKRQQQQLLRRWLSRGDDLFATDVTRYPTQKPTASPTLSPTLRPTQSPSASPTTSEPTESPSISPTTSEPTISPTDSPTTAEPTSFPSDIPTTTSRPTRVPTASPTTGAPTEGPSGAPSVSRYPSESPSDTFVPTGAPTLSVPISTFVLTVYASGNVTAGIARGELENILEVHMLEQAQSEWPDSRIVQINLVLGEGEETANEGEAFMLSGHMICTKDICPSTNETDAFILQHLSNNDSVQQLLTDPMLLSVVDIDISKYSLFEVSEANQYKVPDDDPPFYTNGQLIISILTAGFLCMSATVFVIHRMLGHYSRKKVDKMMKMPSIGEEINYTNSEVTEKRSNIKADRGTTPTPTGFSFENSVIQDSIITRPNSSDWMDWTPEVVRTMLGGSPAVPSVENDNVV